MKAKKWARQARTIVVHLEGGTTPGVHLIEVRDAKKRVLRTRTVEYHNDRPALSAIMIDVQARLSRNALRVDPDSYQFANSGRTLRAAVSLSVAPHRP